MIAKSPKDIEGLKHIGSIVRQTIELMKQRVRSGVSTREIDQIGEAFLNSKGAVSAPREMYSFPGGTCISVNQEVAHGIPGDRIIQPGDLVNIDVSAVLNGYFADAGHSFQVPPYQDSMVKLCDAAYQVMMKVIQELRHGVKLNTVGKIIESEANRQGYKIIRNLCSHGIGRALHEAPHQILPFYNPDVKTVLKEGQVLTIEPFLSTGSEFTTEASDGWTLKVPAGNYVAQHEHTIIITKQEPIIVT
jgi:methionyl aminopeptidase